MKESAQPAMLVASIDRFTGEYTTGEDCQPVIQSHGDQPHIAYSKNLQVRTAAPIIKVIALLSQELRSRHDVITECKSIGELVGRAIGFKMGLPIGKASHGGKWGSIAGASFGSLIGFTIGIITDNFLYKHPKLALLEAESEL